MEQPGYVPVAVAFWNIAGLEHLLVQRVVMDRQKAERFAFDLLYLFPEPLALKPLRRVICQSLDRLVVYVVCGIGAWIRSHPKDRRSCAVDSVQTEVIRVLLRPAYEVIPRKHVLDDGLSLYSAEFAHRNKCMVPGNQRGSTWSIQFS